MPFIARRKKVFPGKERPLERGEPATRSVGPREARMQAPDGDTCRRHSRGGRGRQHMAGKRCDRTRRQQA